MNAHEECEEIIAELCTILTKMKTIEYNKAIHNHKNFKFYIQIRQLLLL